MNKHWKNIQASVNSKFVNPFFCHKKVFLSRVALSLAEMFAPPQATPSGFFQNYGFNFKMHENLERKFLFAFKLNASTRTILVTICSEGYFKVYFLFEDYFGDYFQFGNYFLKK